MERSYNNLTDLPHSFQILQGKSVKLFNHIVKPILDHGKCALDVICQFAHKIRTGVFGLPLSLIVTTHKNHAGEIAKEISLDYDAIVIISGDGLAYEIFNGFMEHENPRAAFAIPLAPVPTGSGNGCCLSLMGLEVRAGSPSIGNSYCRRSTLTQSCLA